MRVVCLGVFGVFGCAWCLGVCGVWVCLVSGCVWCVWVRVVSGCVWCFFVCLGRLVGWCLGVLGVCGCLLLCLGVLGLVCGFGWVCLLFLSLVLFFLSFLSPFVICYSVLSSRFYPCLSSGAGVAPAGLISQEEEEACMPV